MIIGIDFSLKSPAITVFSDAGEITYHAFPRKSTLKAEFAKTLEECDVKVVVLEDEKALPKNSKLADKERSSMVDALMQIDAIIQTLKEHPIDKTTRVAIEGFSFASTGNRLAQISGYQWLLRAQLIKSLGISVENIWIFAPMTIKSTAGKGNYKKEEMIAEFLRESPLDSAFTHALRTAPEKFQNKKGDWLKPIDDIVDSYWVARTLQKTIEKV
jgi:hypothetical protein